MESLLVDLEGLKSAGLPSIVIVEYFLEIVEQELRTNINPNYWNHMETSYSDTIELCQILISGLKSLYESFDRFSSHINFCECLLSSKEKQDNLTYVTKEVQQRYQAIMFYVTSELFDKMIEEFYTAAFKVFKNHEGPEDLDESYADDSIIECPGCSKLTEECQCQDIQEAFHTVNKYLNELGLLERVCTRPVSSIIHLQIKQHITCRGNFETSYLYSLEKWLERKVVGWLSWIYERTSSCSRAVNLSFRQGLEQYLYKSYASTRVDELFNIIIEYPESEPAIHDLKVCLERTDLRATLVTSLKTALQTRLLHPGVNTSDILTAYISAIRALRVLDPTGVVLDLVCQPVRKYLRNRSDTVRCIVSSLTEDSSSDLCDELIKRQPLVLDDSCCGEEHESDDWEKWQPDPVDADPGKTSKSRRTSDIISLLVNIYGSKELFVHEYRNLLADRILSQFNYETSKEVRYLELLKLRFGEAQLHYCEVMIKDVADSRRINQNVTDERAKNNETEGIPVNTMILSAQFWPTFREEKITLPEELQSQLDTYTKSYERLKGNRTLTWKPHLGLMQVTIELKDRKLNLSVSPVHATILWHFQKQPRWTIEALSAELEMPSHALRRKIVYWQSQGVLREEETDTFVLLEEQRHRQAPNGKCQTKWKINFNLIDWNIDFNARDNYNGASNCIGYYFGKFPHRELDTDEIVNGGVPQNANMTFHAIDFLYDVNSNKFLPVCDTEDGVCSRTLDCDMDWVCVEVPDWNNETKWNYPEFVQHPSKKCTVTDTNSPLLGSTVCGYADQAGCVPINREICGRVDPSWYSHCTFNFEWFRPSWATNWSPHLLFYRYPLEPRPLNQTLIDLITIQAIPRFEEWATAYMVRSMELARKVRPNVKWGYYAYPYCYNSANPMLQECRQATQDNNDWHAPIWEASDCLQPSVYMYYDMNRTEASWFHYSSYCEAVRSGFLELGQDYQWPLEPTQFWGDNDVADDYWKCVIPYVTYKHDIVIPAPNLYSTEELWITLRMGQYFGFSGVYIWGSSWEYTDFIDPVTGKSYNTLCALMKDYTTNYIGPYVKLVTAFAQDCGDLRCSGNGRCAHRGSLCDDYTEAERMFQLPLDDFDTTNQQVLEDDWFCKCHEGWKGNHCDVPKHDVSLVHLDDDGMESAMASSQDQREEELQVYWSYIVGMLTNLDALPLERIHSMLRMFVIQGPTTRACSLEELKHFLNRKVRENKLVFIGGVYKLPSKAEH